MVVAKVEVPVTPNVPDIVAEPKVVVAMPAFHLLAEAMFPSAIDVPFQIPCVIVPKVVVAGMLVRLAAEPYREPPIFRFPPIT